jgi:broad specificity phosphatase PhoE
MKKVYFVRHGQSEGNVGPIRQTADAPLTTKGEEQSRFIAKRFSNLKLDKALVSTMKRAQETANIILENKDIPVESSDLYVERRRPSEILGRPKDLPESRKINMEVFENFDVADYRHSDEENFEDLKLRALQILEDLEKREEDNILVVTHGFILRILMAVVVHGKGLTSHQCLGFINTFHHENTGVTVLGYDDEKQRWWVWVWNDHAHLEELSI